MLQSLTILMQKILVATACALYQRGEQDQFLMRGHCFASLMRGMHVRTHWHILFYVFSDRMKFTSPAGPGRIWSMWSTLMCSHNHSVHLWEVQCCLDSCYAFASIDAVDIARIPVLLCCCSDLIAGQILFLIWSYAQSSNSTWAKLLAGKKYICGFEQFLYLPKRRLQRLKNTSKIFKEL